MIDSLGFFLFCFFDRLIWHVFTRRRLSCLMASSQRGSDTVVEALLQKGAEVNVTSAKNETALMFASMNSHSEIVKLLLDFDAKVSPLVVQ